MADGARMNKTMCPDLYSIYYTIIAFCYISSIVFKPLVHMTLNN